MHAPPLTSVDRQLALLRLNSDFLHNFSPLGALRANERAELVRRHDVRLETLIYETLAHILLLERSGEHCA